MQKYGKKCNKKTENIFYSKENESKKDVMGIINKEEALYLSAGIDLTGLKEGKQEVLEVLQTLMREASAMDIFGGVSMAGLAAFTETAAGLSALSEEFDRLTAGLSGRFPEIGEHPEELRNEILALTTELPVGAVECARTLDRIVSSGKRGSEALEWLRVAARRAVAEVEDLEVALEQLDGAMPAGDGSGVVGLQAVPDTMEAQLQMLQNRMLVVLRPLGAQLMAQVSAMAAGLGQALKTGTITGSLQDLETLVSLAAAALRDYKSVLGESAAAVTAEATALEMASDIQQAYQQVVEAGRVLGEEQLVQQAGYRSSLTATGEVEEEVSRARLAFARESIGVTQQLSGIVAEEVTRINRKREAYAGELQMKQAILDSAGEELLKAGEVREARQKEYDVLKWGNDQMAANLAQIRLQEAAEQEAAVAVGVDNARREVRNAQLKLETANRQAATASVVAGTVATGGTVVADTAATASTTLLARAKQAATVATRSLTAALKANPLGMVLTVVSLAISAFSAFGKETGKTADEQERLNEALRKQGENLGALNSTLFNEGGGDIARAEALLKLKELLPQVYGKVELANLAEQDRNQLLKEGNRELLRRRKLELEAMQAASQEKIKELSVPKYSTIVWGSSAGVYSDAKATVDRGSLSKEQEHYRKISAELEYIHTLEILIGELGLTKEQRLERYKKDLKEMKGRLQEVNTELKLIFGEKAEQMDFNPAMFPAAAGWLQEKEQLEGKIAVTEDNIKKAEKDRPAETDLLRRREQMEQALTDLVGQMVVRREKEAIQAQKQGVEQQLELINWEYDRKAKEIDKKERELEELYGKGKVPEKEQQMIGQLREDNETQRKNATTQVQDEYNAKAKKHIAEEETAFLSAEDRKLQAIKDRYRQELKWAGDNKDQWENEDDYKKYTDNLKGKFEADKLAVMLPNLRNFAEEVQNIQDKWKAWIDEAKNGGDIELQARLELGQTEELSKLHADQIINSEEWVSLFSEMDELTVTEIDNLIATIEREMAGADLQPIDRKALVKNLNEAKQQVVTMNPFRALGNSFQSVFTQGSSSSKKSSEEVRDNWKQLGKSTQGCFDFINDAMDGCEVLGDLIGESGRASMAMVQGIASAGIAMATAVSTAEKSSAILTVISAALQVVTALFSIFNKDKKKEARIQSLQVGIDGLERAYNRLGDAIDHTYSDKAFDMMDQQNENLRQQQELIRQQIAEEQSKKKTDDSKIREWQNKLEDIDDQLAENQRKRIEMLAGTDVKSAIDEFADALVDAYAKGEDGAVALAETTKKVMANAVKEALKRRFLGQQIDDAVNFLGNAMNDGALSWTEKNTFQNMVQAAGRGFSEALKVYDDLFADTSALSEGGVSGQLQEAMTEGTANQLVGLWNMTANDIRSMRNLTAEQLTQSTMMNLNVGEVLRQQYQIEANTRRTADNTALTADELKNGFTRLEGRLKTIDENTRGYTGRGK